jgi:hypothetical protein
VRLALVLLAVLTLAAPAHGLEVQDRWRVVGVAVSTSRTPALAPSLVKRVLEEAGSTIARELPGVRWEVSARVREARYRDDGSGAVRAHGAGLRDLVGGLLSDPEVAAADLVVVYAPLSQERLFGLALQRAQAQGKRVWYAVVNAAPGRIVEQRLGIGALGRVAGLALERGPLAPLALRGTTVHEFGHFLAPGTRDVRAVDRLVGWIGNGPDEPDRHDPSCVMWTPDARSLLAKARAFPRLIGFCDRCRERTGCSTRPRRFL